MRGGGTLPTAQVHDRYIDRAVSLLEQHGAVELDGREETWRNAGWTGGQAGGAGLAMTGTASATTLTTTETRRAAATGKDDVPQVDEEAAVAKSARVVEEVGIRKDATDRVETGCDTVRSTKV